MKEKSGSRLVYSSDWGKMCGECEQPVDSCKCNKNKVVAKASKDGIIRVGRATAGRKGSGVTTVSGFAGNAEELKKILTELKKKCGAGGAIKNGQIEIQGEHRDRVVEELAKMGFKARRGGG